ncbi:MAG TPA: hypothetical protein VHA52_09900 [Candidatus Babeliaceae bacterium]|nr:hypothetical protein [Candidatus Babeliaceae bacterium]
MYLSNPALVSYLQSQQQGAPPQGNLEQGMMQQPQEEYNPFKSGAMAALEASRRSRAYRSEEDDRRAFGKGLMAFSSQMAQPTGIEGFGGTLQALNNSFTPAYKAYEDEQRRVEAENAVFLQAYEEQQMQRALQEQRERQHLIDREEKRRLHAEDLAYKREKDKSLNDFRDRQLSQQQSYQSQKLTMQEKKMMQDMEKVSRAGKPIPAAIINKVSKELEHLKAAENEYQNYEVAKELLKEGDPLLNPVAEAAFSFIGGRPEKFYNPDQALFAEMAGDIKGQIAERLGFKTDASRKNIKTIHPGKSWASNLKIIEQAQKRLDIEAVREKKERYEKWLEAVQNGENPNIQEVSPETSLAPAIPPAPEGMIAVKALGFPPKYIPADKAEEAKAKGLKIL